MRNILASVAVVIAEAGNNCPGRRSSSPLYIIYISTGNVASYIILLASIVSTSNGACLELSKIEVNVGPTNSYESSNTCTRIRVLYIYVCVQHCIYSSSNAYIYMYIGSRGFHASRERKEGIKCARVYSKETTAEQRDAAL